jgi:hypothetical protein
MTKKDASKKEPMPIVGKDAILPLVINDLKQRNYVGIKKYGTTLESHNGRDALMDAYQEILDAAMYLRQLLAERDDG